MRQIIAGLPPISGRCARQWATHQWVLLLERLLLHLDAQHGSCTGRGLRGRSLKTLTQSHSASGASRLNPLHSPLMPFNVFEDWAADAMLSADEVKSAGTYESKRTEELRHDHRIIT